MTKTTKRIETVVDIRYKAWKELITFINWLAENYPEEWEGYMLEYTKFKSVK